MMLMLCHERVGLSQSQPDNTFSFYSLTAGVRASGFPFTYNVDDFAFSAANLNNDPIYVRATLDADNSSFQFGEPDGSGGLLCATQDTYAYDDRELSPLGTYAWNVLNVSVAATTSEFTGSLTLESNGQEDFYVFSPNTFYVSGSNPQSTICAAYKTVWQGAAWNVPWYWDGTANKLVSPYANYWYKNTFWDTGWNSLITIINNNASTADYTVHYRSWVSGGVPTRQDPTNSCAVTNLSTESQTLTVPGSGGNWSGNLRSDVLGVSTSYEVQQDGFMWITLNPVQSGTSPGNAINPNSSGSSTICDGSGCPIVTSCHY